MAWRDIILPRPDGTGGILRAVVSFRRTPGTVELEARTGHGGWRVTAHSKSGKGPDVTAGLVRATVRLPDRPPFELSWPPGLPPGVPVAAIVSDVPRFADDRQAQRAVRALYGFLPALTGRTNQRDEREAAYRSAILAFHKAGYADNRITARLVLQRLDRTGDDSQLREDVGPWRPFRDRVIRGE
jgi:hypothetical protein